MYAEKHAAGPQPRISDSDEIEIAGHRYATPKRLSELLGVSERTLARWNARRIGPPKIQVGKFIVYDVAKLPDWLASRETQPIRHTRH